MNENTNEMTAKYDAVKKDMGRLPVPLAVSIHPIANKGTVKDGVVNNAFQIMVKGVWNGAEVWMPESEWYIKNKMKTTRKIYATFEKAQAAKAEIKSKWGVATSKKAKAEKAKEEMKAKDDELAALRAVCEQLKAELAKRVAA